MLPHILSTWRRRLGQDKYTSLSHTSSEDVFKTSCLRRIYSVVPYFFKTSSRHFQVVFKTSSKSLAKMSSGLLQDILKTFWRSLQGIFKIFLRTLTNGTSRPFEKCLQGVLQRCPQDSFKIFSRCLQKVFKTSSRRLQDVSSN